MKHPNAEQFLEHVKDHVLTINVDQGLYRDLTVKIPDSVNRHYHITTRPGYLTISGDMGCYVFKRIPDMFEFFWNDQLVIKPGYWHEKLQAQSIYGDGATAFCFKTVRQRLHEELNEFLEGLDMEDEDDQENAKMAKSAVYNFMRTEESEHEYVSAINNWDSIMAGGMELCDFWECQPEDYTYHYIWCCYAVVYAIQLYNAQKKEQEIAA